jgi:hypothetical protein
MARPNPKEEARIKKILDKNKKQTSPKGIIAAETAAKKAIEKKYPGLFIPETKISPPGRRGR